jgi:hypothetical protein
MMCEMCDKNAGEPVGCPDCGRLVCFDFEGFDDITSRAVGNSHGDLSCIPCARRTQAEDDRAAEEEAELYFDPAQDVP